MPPLSKCRLFAIDSGSAPYTDCTDADTSASELIADAREEIATLDPVYKTGNCSESQSSNQSDLDNIVDNGGSDSGNREFSADIGSNDGTYIESISISKLEYARFDTSIYDDHEVSRPLYPGSNLTLLQALVKYMLWFTEHPYVSKEAMSDMLKFQHVSVLPSNNILPDSFSKALKLWSLF